MNGPVVVFNKVFFLLVEKLKMATNTENSISVRKCRTVFLFIKTMKLIELKHEYSLHFGIWVCMFSFKIVFESLTLLFRQQLFLTIKS